MRLKDQVAIITGGGQGIGRAYAERFATEGARVVVADVNEANAQAVAKAIGGGALGVKVDVSDEASCNALAKSVAEQCGRIDILLNNAAIFHGLDRKDQSLDYFNKILSVNMTGVWLMTRAVERTMKHQKRGKIINQSSTAAYMSNTGFIDTSNPDNPSPPFHYSLAKLGVSGLTKYFAGALGPFGVNVNAICPGVTLTEATKTVVPEQIMQAIVGNTALRRALQPEDLTGTAVYLASSDSDLMTGQVLVVDGGMIMLG
jgi:NAD(P)-dependent dehydrogenase (short-subunit alcohol dehydrogenase family)